MDAMFVNVHIFVQVSACFPEAVCGDQHVTIKG